VVAFLILGYQGTQPAAPSGSLLERVSQLCTLIYFAFFLLMPLWSRLGTFRPVPDRVTFAGH
jgi:ubiquinol-cytochrome c reductase cytochrome b subunit